MPDTLVRLLQKNDYTALVNYLEGLSDITRSRFAPHSFDLGTLQVICANEHDNYQGYACFLQAQLIGYAVTARGCTEGEIYRFPNYGIAIDAFNDYAFAPSVADRFQSKGVGSTLFEFVINDLKIRGARQIALMGGVQLSNHVAIKFYRKHGFKTLGEFEYHGQNLDMIKHLR